MASLPAGNLGQAAPGDGLRAALASFALAAFVLLIAQSGLKRWPAAAVLASLTLLLFSTCGHVYNQIEGLQLAG